MFCLSIVFSLADRVSEGCVRPVSLKAQGEEEPSQKITEKRLGG